MKLSDVVTFIHLTFEIETRIYQCLRRKTVNCLYLCCVLPFALHLISEQKGSLLSDYLRTRILIC